MSAEDSTRKPFTGTILEPIKPISTIGIITPYDKNITGCNRKCPCRIWIQCHYYNNTKWNKSRRSEDEHTKIIWDYYDNIFRVTYDMPIANMNG